MANITNIKGEYTLVKPDELLDVKDEFMDFLDVTCKNSQLEDHQKEDLYTILTSNMKGFLLTHEMGMGKSYILMYLAHISKCMNPFKKVLITAPTDSMGKIKKLIEDNTNWTVGSTTGDARKVAKLINNFNDYDIILAQQSTWQSSLDFHILIYNNIHKFSISIYDEASSLKSNSGFSSFVECSRLFEKTVLMNATALDSSIEKAFMILRAIVDENIMYDSFSKRYSIYDNKLKKSYLNSQALMFDFNKYIVNRNRTDIGVIINIHTIFYRCISTYYQETLNSAGGQISKVLYNPLSLRGFINQDIPLTFTKKDIPALRCTFDIINSIPRNENIVIVLGTHGASDRIRDELLFMKRDVFEINGKTTKTAKDKEDISDKFNNSTGGIALITIEKALSLNSARHIILYGLPADMPQAVFRIVRGNENKSVCAHIIYYPWYENAGLLKKERMLMTNNKALNRKSNLESSIVCETQYIENNMNRFRPKVQ